VTDGRESNVLQDRPQNKSAFSPELVLPSGALFTDDEASKKDCHLLFNNYYIIL